jgi:hypothetical protein
VLIDAVEADREVVQQIEREGLLLFVTCRGH